MKIASGTCNFHVEQSAETTESTEDKGESKHGEQPITRKRRNAETQRRGDEREQPEKIK